MPDLTPEELEKQKKEDGSWKKGVAADVFLKIFADFKGYETDFDLYERAKVIKKFMRENLEKNPL